jgi:PAS domain S-box-containing protein
MILAISFVTLNSSLVIANAQLQGQAKIDSLLKELPKMKNDTNAVNLLSAISYALYSINPDEGIKYGLQGILLSEKIQWKKGIALSSKNLGVCYWSKSNYPRALDYYFKSLKINEEIGNKLGVAINFGNIGIIYLEQFNFQKALEYFFKALKVFEELGDKDGIARNLGNIGLVYRSQSNDSLALDYYFKALKMYQNLNNKSGISINLGNIGNIYANQSDYSEALKYFFKALNVFEELGDKSGTARNLGNIGGLYIRLANDTVFSKIKERTNFISLTKEANLKSGIEYSLKAVKICQEIGDLNSLVEFYRNLYAGHKSYGNYTKALEFHELYQITNDSVFNIENSHHIANLEAKRETQLKEKEIEVLNKEKQNQVVIKNFLIILSIIGVFITLLILFFYHRKKKVNLLLEEKNGQINNANIELEQLNESLGKTNQIIEQQNEQLNILINNLPVFIYFKDENLKYITVNDLFAGALGKQKSEIIGFSDEELNDPDYNFHKKVDIEIIANKQPSINIERMYINPKEEKYWASTTKVPYCDEQGNVVGIIGIVQDITYFKEAEEKLKVLNNTLEKHSEQLEIIVSERTQELVVAMKEIEKASKLKTEIIANMNHEIRTPLTFIKCAAALVKMIVVTDNPVPELIETIDSLNLGVNRLNRTMELFADLSELKSGNYKPRTSAFNLRSVLGHHLLTYNKLITEQGKSLEIVFSSTTDEAYTMADEISTDRTIEFIIDNAVKFTENGYVKIDLTETETQKYLISIEDTGIGMSDEYKAKVFEPFSQEDMSATRKYEGIGLSLSLAHEFAIKNNFKMGFESEKGKGTKFVLEFDKYDIDEI